MARFFSTPDGPVSGPDSGDWFIVSALGTWIVSPDEILGSLDAREVNEAEYNELVTGINAANAEFASSTDDASDTQSDGN
jgi:hypothetical protein